MTNAQPSDRQKFPNAFILRRLHSVLGVWLVLYLCEHLLINAQAALFFEDGGHGFITAVNKIHQLPYLKAIEVFLLAVPFAIHGIWGIVYALTGKFNSLPTDGSQPFLKYKRNRAYSWQRITSWILLIGILAHVVHMRFLNNPEQVIEGEQKYYVVRVTQDRGLADVASKLNTSLEKTHKGDVLAYAPNIGTAFLLAVRDTFKNPWMVMLYSLLAIAAAYHAFNGLWTFMITWGITVTLRAQNRMRKITSVLMGIVIFLGLMASWGTYWVTQFQG